MTRRLATLLLLAAGALAGPAAAGDARLGDLRVEQAWARATIGLAKAGAAYFTVTNGGTTTDRLLAVGCRAAKRCQLHHHAMVDGVMRMRPVAAIELAPGAPVVLRPGALHVMLIGLKAPLKQGERFPLTLDFERAGRLEVQVKVRAPTATHGGPDGAS